MDPTGIDTIQTLDPDEYKLKRMAEFSIQKSMKENKIRRIVLCNHVSLKTMFDLHALGLPSYRHIIFIFKILEE